LVHESFFEPEVRGGFRFLPKSFGYVHGAVEVGVKLIQPGGVDFERDRDLQVGEGDVGGVLPNGIKHDPLLCEVEMAVVVEGLFRVLSRSAVVGGRRGEPLCGAGQSD